MYIYILYLVFKFNAVLCFCSTTFQREIVLYRNVTSTKWFDSISY